MRSILNVRNAVRSSVARMREFWATADTTEYFDGSKAKRVHHGCQTVVLRFVSGDDGLAAERTHHFTTGGSIAEPLTAAQLLSRVEQYQFPAAQGWTVHQETPPQADGPTPMRCSADWSKPWRVLPVLSAAQLVAALEEASTAGQVNDHGDAAGVAFAVEDATDMRTAAEGQLLAMLQHGMSVLFVSDHAVELFPDDDDDLSLDLGLLSDDELEALAFGPGAIDDIAKEI